MNTRTEDTETPDPATDPEPSAPAAEPEPDTEPGPTGPPPAAAGTGPDGVWDTRPPGWPWQQDPSVNTVTLTCLGRPGSETACGETVTVGREADSALVTLAAARSIAEAQGWRTDVRGFDLCPACALQTGCRLLRPRRNTPPQHYTQPVFTPHITGPVFTPHHSPVPALT